MRAVVITRTGGRGPAGAGAAGPAGRARARCGSRSGPQGSTSPTRWRGSASTRTLPKPPSVVGYEVAGEIETVGEGVERLLVGDRVMAGTRFGGYAELVAVPAGQVAAAAGVAELRAGRRRSRSTTAPPTRRWSLMGGLREGDRLLIHAAAGGVGIAATQIAAHAAPRSSAPPRPPSTTRSARRASTTRSTTARQDFAAEVMRITGGEGVDVVIDALGPSSFRKDYRLLRPGGRLIMYGLSESRPARARHRGGRCRACARMPRRRCRGGRAWRS